LIATIRSGERSRRKGDDVSEAAVASGAVQRDPFGIQRAAQDVRLATQPEGEPVGLDLRIETPENVVLTYRLAGPAVRAAAYLIDTLVRALVFGLIFVFALCAGIAAPGLGLGTILLALFVVEWCYFVVAEGLFHGKTIGKGACGLRTIQRMGYPLTFWGALLRNLLRAVDAILLYGVGFATMLVSGHFRRLGDLAADTVVISERAAILPKEPVILEKIQPLAREEVGSWRPEPRTLSAIEHFLGRRNVLSIERGHRLARPLARALADRLQFRGDPQLPARFAMAFLARVYVTFQQPPDPDETWAEDESRGGRRRRRAERDERRRDESDRPPRRAGRSRRDEH
jgi:uncharacterized RDD family membrane protein YckC